MAVFHPHTVACACGAQLTVHLADSVNARRLPELRQMILDGRLHRADCGSCGRRFTVERSFYYVDLEENLLFRVCPRNERHLWKEMSRDLDAASALVPAGLADTDGRRLRVLFGMDELREKLVAQDAGLDDRLVELMKVMVVHEHPVLLRRPRLRLALTAVTETHAEFGAAYEHAGEHFLVQLPRARAEALAADQPRLAQWARDAHHIGLFELEDHWVNLWRWSPQPGALDTLRSCVAAIGREEPVDLDGKDFRRMLAGLPRGTHLPPWAKRDLRTLYDYVKPRRPALEDALFEIRFGIELEDDWSTNADTEDIDSLWKLLKDLPDANVEGNTKIRQLLLEPGGGGWYDPGSNDIAIGSQNLSRRTRFENVVRHEIAHAVHEMRPDLVNGWLEQEFGWRVLGRTDAEIDEWVGLMGGWGALSIQQKRDVRLALRTALGNGSSWNPGPAPQLPAGHPWHAANFGPRLAYERSRANWYSHHPDWYRAGGKAFFLNYWYQTLMVVDAGTLDRLVTNMPDDYAAMSHFEFFAELYALYYDPTDDRRRFIPPQAAAWMDANIGALEVNAPRPAAPRAAREWEGVRRPS